MSGGGAIGGAFQMVGSLMQGQSTADALEHQAEIMRRNAIAAMEAAKFDASKQQVMATKVLGAQSAGYASSGVEQTSGSVLDVIAASAANAELDKQSILHGGELRRINFENQASIDEKAAGNALTASYFGAAAGAAKTGFSIYENMMPDAKMGSDSFDVIKRKNDPMLTSEDI